MSGRLVLFFRRIGVPIAAGMSCLGRIRDWTNFGKSSAVWHSSVQTRVVHPYNETPGIQSWISYFSLENRLKHSPGIARSPDIYVRGLVA